MTASAHQLPAVEYCRSCDGHGVIDSYAWTYWLHTYATAKADFEAVHPDEDWYRSPEHAELDAVMPDEPETFDCIDCDGTGRNLADAVLDLLWARRTGKATR